MQGITMGLAAGALLMSAAVSVVGPPQPPPLEKAKPGPLNRENTVNGPLQPLSREEAAEAFGALPAFTTLTDNEIASLSRGIQPEVLTWDRIYALALVRLRARRGGFSPTLDPAALALEAARQGVADFARFRINFHSNGPFHDPGRAVFALQGRLLAIDNARRSVWVHEGLHRLIVERSRGISSGLNQMDVDTAFSSLLRARQKLADELAQFRDGLDELKFLLGLSPRAPVILDRQNITSFSAVFDLVEGWQRRTDRRAQELHVLIDQLPALGEVVVGGEPILARIDKNPDQMEEVLGGAAQLAFKNRSERDQVATQPDSGVQLELRVRHGIRGMFDKMLAYRAEKRRYELAIRLKEQAIERLVVPPSPAITSRSSLLKGVIEQQTEVVDTQDRLIRLWTSFRAERLALYHDLGVLPHGDWKSFLADLPAVPVVTAHAVPASQPNPTAGHEPGPHGPPAPAQP